MMSLCSFLVLSLGNIAGGDSVIGNCISPLWQLSEHRELRSAFSHGHHPFYEEALQMAEDGKISCRVLRYGRGTTPANKGISRISGHSLILINFGLLTVPHPQDRVVGVPRGLGLLGQVALCARSVPGTAARCDEDGCMGLYQHISYFSSLLLFE